MANYVPCPKCGTPDPKRLNFTWWGGAIGPRLVSHVKCQSCKHKFNGKNGGPNTGAILIYSVVVFALAFVVFLGIGILFAVMK